MFTTCHVDLMWMLLRNLLQLLSIINIHQNLQGSCSLPDPLPHLKKAVWLRKNTLCFVPREKDSAILLKPWLPPCMTKYTKDLRNGIAMQEQLQTKEHTDIVGSKDSVYIIIICTYIAIANQLIMFCDVILHNSQLS